MSNSKKKILLVSTVSRQFWLFEQTNIEVLRSKGYEVHGAANFSDRDDRLSEVSIVEHDIDIQRFPFSIKNFRAYRQLKDIIRNEGIDVVHAHSPVGGVLGRLAAKSCGVSQIIYTAHGFHFFRGAKLFNWLLYFPIEKLMSYFTDDLITINQEDFSALSEFRFKMKRSFLINGIGLDSDRFQAVSQLEKEILRDLKGLPKGKILLLSVGELSTRKNQIHLLKVMKHLKDTGQINYHLLLVGKGDMLRKYESYIFENDLQECVSILGFRHDVSELMQASDVLVSASLQEGLPVNIMEAMSIGMPSVVSDCRGNRDLIHDAVNGYVIPGNNVELFAQRIVELSENRDLFLKMTLSSREISKQYSKSVVREQMKKIYF